MSRISLFDPKYNQTREENMTNVTTSNQPIVETVKELPIPPQIERIINAPTSTPEEFVKLMQEHKGTEFIQTEADVGGNPL